MAPHGIGRFQDRDSLFVLIASVQEQLRDPEARVEIARDLHAVFSASPPAEIIGGVARVLAALHPQDGGAVVDEWRKAAPEMWRLQGMGAAVIEKALGDFSRLPSERIYDAVTAAAQQNPPVPPQNVADDQYDALYIALSVDVRPLLKTVMTALMEAAAANRKETMDAIAATGGATSRPVAAPKTARFKKPQMS